MGKRCVYCWSLITDERGATCPQCGAPRRLREVFGDEDIDLLVADDTNTSYSVLLCKQPIMDFDK